MRGALGTLCGLVAVLALVLGVSHGTAPDPDGDAAALASLASAQAPATPPAPSPTQPAPTPPKQPEWIPDPVDISTLPPADTWAIMPEAPIDPDQGAIPSGDVATPNEEPGVALYTSPDHGQAFAYLPTVQYVGETSYPIIDQTPAWLQVMISPRHGIPSEVGAEHVNGTTGWVLRSDVTVSHNPYLVTVDLSTETIEIRKDGAVQLTSTVGIGKPASPTPVTRTFIMATYHDPQTTYSPMLVALASHSPVYDSYFGGPAPTAIHTYTREQWHGQISNGCLRVPSDVLDQFTALPLGTPVVIWAKAPAASPAANSTPLVLDEAVA